MRHAIIFVISDEAVEEQAGVGFAGSDRGFVAVARLEQGMEGVDAVTTFVVILFVTAEAFVGEDGGEVFAEGNGGGGEWDGGGEVEQDDEGDFCHGRGVLRLKGGLICHNKRHAHPS